MNISIIGAGNMAKGIGTRLLAGGNSVTIINHTQDKAEDLAKELNDNAGGQGSAEAGTYGGDLTDEVVILALPYEAVKEVIADYSEKLAGKIVIDISNPLNDSYDDLATEPGVSAAEETAKLVPEGTKVVKAFNTTFAGTLVNGEVAGHQLDVFIAGDDADAKKTIADLVSAGGLRPIDIGGLAMARHIESVGFLGISLQQTLGTNYMSAWKIIS